MTRYSSHKRKQQQALERDWRKKYGNVCHQEEEEPIQHPMEIPGYDYVKKNVFSRLLYI